MLYVETLRPRNAYCPSTYSQLVAGVWGELRCPGFSYRAAGLDHTSE